LKVFTFRAGGRIGKHTKPMNFNLEKTLFYTCILLIVLLVGAQILNPFLDKFSNNGYDFRGRELSEQEFLYNTGTISLKLIDKEYDVDAKILVNGDEVANFDTNPVNITVKESDVIQIDGSSCKNALTVAILDTSSKIKDKDVLKTVEVENGIKTIGQIRMRKACP